MGNEKWLQVETQNAQGIRGELVYNHYLATPSRLSIISHFEKGQHQPSNLCSARLFQPFSTHRAPFIYISTLVLRLCPKQGL